jgi:hypothetical protein
MKRGGPVSTGRADDGYPDTIRCGRSHPHPHTEVVIQRSRPGPIRGGCGKLIRWWNAYRCVECGVWMHRTCLREHFALHRDAPHDTVAP